MSNEYEFFVRETKRVLKKLKDFEDNDDWENIVNDAYRDYIEWKEGLK